MGNALVVGLNAWDATILGPAARSGQKGFSEVDAIQQVAGCLRAGLGLGSAAAQDPRALTADTVVLQNTYDVIDFGEHERPS